MHLPPTCPVCHAALDRKSEGRVLVGVTGDELASAIGGAPLPTLIVRFVRALALIDKKRAEKIAKTLGLNIG